MSGKKPPIEKLATSREIYHRIRWDPRIDRTAYSVGYEDRGQGMQEIAFGEFEPDGDIPWHRVWSFRRGDEVMWDRKLRIDKLSEGEPAEASAGERDDDAPLPIPLVEPAAGEVIPLIPYRFDEGRGAWLPSEGAEAELASSAFRTPGSLSVITFNVLCDLHDAEKVKSDVRLPHLLAILRSSDADVIALQEVTPELLRALLAEAWVKQRYFASDSPRGDTVLPTGEVLLSRYPMRRLVRHRFTKRKTALVAELAVGERGVHAGVVHLSSNRGTRPQEKRAAQLWTLLDTLAAAAGDDADSLLVGDFNAGEHELDELTSAYGFSDGWRSLHPGEPGFTYDPERNALAKLTSLSGQRSRYDRVLFRSPGRRLRAQTAALLGTQDISAALFPSDHYALRCALSLDEGRDDAAISAEDSAALDAAALTHHSALVLIPPEATWPQIQAIRAKHDKSYRRFMPHVTLLYGFVPEAHFAAAAARVQAVARQLAPFAVQLGALATFVHRGSQTVWSQPKCQPAAALVELQAALQAAFPTCTEQSTRSAAGFTPHLTVAQQPTARDDAERAAHEAQLAAWRRGWHPLSFRAAEVALISRRGDEPFEVRYRVELGSGAIAGDGMGDIAAPIDATPIAAAPPTLPPLEAAPLEAAPLEAAPLGAAHARALELLRAAAARVLAAVPDLLPDELRAGTLLGDAPSDALVHVLGSARLGTATAESDLDAFCAGPAALPRERFFAALTDELRATGQLAHARAVPAAFVPVLELSLAGVAVDLAYVALPAEALAAAAVFPAAELPATWLAATAATAGAASAPPALDFPSHLTLLGAADADALLAAAARTSGLARYRQLAAWLSRWAKRRAIHGNAHGFLGGFSWAVLAAWTVETFPDHGAASSLGALLTHLFSQLAAWDFHRPLALAGSDGYQPTRRREALVLLAPAYPARNTARNVLRATLTVLRNEFVAARDALSAFRTEKLDDEAALDAALAAPFTPPPSSANAALLTVSFHCAPVERAVCRGWLDSQAIALLRDLEDDYRLRPFVSADALIIHLQSPTTAPLSSRVALAALARLADQFAAWPDRPAAAALRTSLD